MAPLSRPKVVLRSPYPLHLKSSLLRRNSARVGNDPNSMIDASLTLPAPGGLAGIHRGSMPQRNLRGRHAAVCAGRTQRVESLASRSTDFSF